MEEYLLIALRTLFLYVVILITFRLMGKREIGELSVLDLVIYMMIAELVVLSIESPNEPVIRSLLPIFLLMAVQIGLAYFSMKNKKFRDIVDGRPSILINKGKIDEKAMREQRYNFDDLLLQLRENNVVNVSDVEFAILETSGKLSVFEKVKAKGEITIPLILDGEIQEDGLERIDKTSLWLRQHLKALGYKDIKAISFCSYQNDRFYVDLKDIEK
ncbi:DUF421 domain-containing protein [Mesobacillus harenae]|uniref:DUF421 domain-containing protein n=1 Tax=Mesobacillus harenae TaxID=2213203 RepID=UPI00157FD1F1|nr:DUF421 domain-containing protein [Mesobacillus harenae]